MNNIYSLIRILKVSDLVEPPDNGNYYQLTVQSDLVILGFSLRIFNFSLINLA